MISSILKSFGLILRNPLLLLPALLAGIANSIIIELLKENLIELLVRWSSQGFFPVTEIEAPFYFVAVNLNLFLIVLLGIFFMFIVNGITVFAYAEYIKEKQQNNAGVLKALINSWKKIPRIALITLFFAMIALMLAVFFSLSIAISATLDIIGLIFALIIILLSIYLAIKFAFTLTVMGFEETNVKESLKKTWEFSRKHSIEIIFFLIILSVITALLAQLGVFLLSLTQNEWILILIPIIITLIVSSFSNLAFAIYYSSKQNA
ncbi:MAG: hypothetical protein Q7S21_03425 [archaeon]|nr:hypothetical protein [archaeon]